MAAQAFCYNAVFFTYALILTQFYDIAVERHRAGSCCRSRSATFSAR